MTEKTMIRVWDPFIRAFHWGLVAVVALAWLSAMSIPAPVDPPEHAPLRSGHVSIW